MQRPAWEPGKAAAEADSPCAAGGAVAAAIVRQIKAPLLQRGSHGMLSAALLCMRYHKLPAFCPSHESELVHWNHISCMVMIA